MPSPPSSCIPPLLARHSSLHHSPTSSARSISRLGVCVSLSTRSETGASGNKVSRKLAQLVHHDSPSPARATRSVSLRQTHRPEPESGPQELLERTRLYLRTEKRSVTTLGGQAFETADVRGATHVAQVAPHLVCLWLYASHARSSTSGAAERVSLVAVPRVNPRVHALASFGRA